MSQPMCPGCNNDTTIIIHGFFFNANNVRIPYTYAVCYVCEYQNDNDEPFVNTN